MYDFQPFWTQRQLSVWYASTLQSFAESAYLVRLWVPELDRKVRLVALFVLQIVPEPLGVVGGLVHVRSPEGERVLHGDALADLFRDAVRFALERVVALPPSNVGAAGLGCRGD